MRRLLVVSAVVMPSCTAMPAGGKTVLVAPKTVVEKIPEALRSKAMVRIVTNGDKAEAAGITVEAVPAYNTTPGKEMFHPKGRDNGYVIVLVGWRTAPRHERTERQ